VPRVFWYQPRRVSAKLLGATGGSARGGRHPRRVVPEGFAGRASPPGGWCRRASPGRASPPAGGAGGLRRGGRHPRRVVPVDAADRAPVRRTADLGAAAGFDRADGGECAADCAVHELLALWYTDGHRGRSSRLALMRSKTRPRYNGWLLVNYAG